MMSIPKLFTFLSCCFISINALAQTPKAIEDDLYKSFKKIDYRKEDNTEANDVFGEKLRSYAEKYPFTIDQNFGALKTEHLDISGSSDGLFRVYSWDTWTGGTMHFFESVFQYKSGIKTIAVLDTPKSDGDNRPNYKKVYTFKNNGKTYYLCVYLMIGSSRDMEDGIKIFAIEDGKLNDNVKLIKTKTGLHSGLSYGYDFFSVLDWKVRPTIYFDSATETIRLPMVDGNQKITHQYLVYKFTGQYFERVKN